jgi:leucyl aminopeptidase (aminopeptidase T)
MRPVPSKTSDLERAREGAARALDLCLGLTMGDAVAIFHDETTADCADIFRDVAAAHGLVAAGRLVSCEEQRAFGTGQRLAGVDVEAIELSRAVVLCVSAGKEGRAWRKAVVETAVDTQRYVGAIPGATVQLLADAVNIDYQRVRLECEDLAVAMLAGERAVLTSYWTTSSGEQAHELTFSLGRFGRCPITSPGIIPRGTWGNLPGGETFIAPLEGLSSGSFVLNGAFSGCVLNPSLPILLEVSDGFLTRMHGPAPERDLLSTVLGWQGERSDHLGLAELGIGLNAGIRELTGSALSDEKKAGTAHIAFGENTIYGGTLTSTLHEDLVTRAPSLTIDDKPILDRGRFVLDAADWREAPEQMEATGAELRDDFLITKTSWHASGDAARHLRVRRDVGARRQCSYAIGTPALSIQIAAVYDVLPPMPENIWFSRLVAMSGAPSTYTRAYLKGLLAVLRKHGLVTLTPCGEEGLD